MTRRSTPAPSPTHSTDLPSIAEAMLKARKHSDGTTLIELVIVVLVMAILASIALPAFGRTHAQVQLESAADHLASALRYAQSMAVNECGTFAVCPSVQDNEFYVADMAARSEPIQNPLTMKPYRLSFGDHRLFDGVTLAATSFTAPIQFDSLGSPVAGGWLELKVGDDRMRVEVQAITGRIRVERPTS